jgi:hypothetical protein
VQPLEVKHARFLFHASLRYLCGLRLPPLIEGGMRRTNEKLEVKAKNLPQAAERVEQPPLPGEVGKRVGVG